METLEFLHEQVSKLSDKVEQLNNQVGNIHVGCNLRHNVDLASEIQKVNFQVINLDQLFKKHELTVKQSIEAHKEINSHLDEIKIVIDSIKLRVSNLEKQVFQKQQRYFTIKSQIFITVVGAIILSILTALGSLIYDKIINNYGNNQIQNVRSGKHYSPQHQPSKNNK